MSAARARKLPWHAVVAHDCLAMVYQPRLVDHALQALMSEADGGPLQYNCCGRRKGLGAFRRPAAFSKRRHWVPALTGQA